MKKIWLSVIVVMLFSAACVFKPGRSDRSSIVLARVDGKTVTAAQLDSIAVKKAVIINDTTDVESLKTALLDSLIDLKLTEIREDSIVLGLEYERDFLDKRKDELASTVLRLMYEGEIVSNANIDSSEVIGEYQDNSDKYIDPEQLKASHILIKIPPPDTFGVGSEEKMKEAFEKNKKETLIRAKAVMVKANQGENWDSLVVKYSQDMTNNNKGGDLGYFARGAMVPAFDSAAFAADVGDIVGPVETRYGFHIIRIDDHKPESALELDDELFNKIKTTLKRAKEKELADGFVDSLKTAAKYTYNEEILEQPDSLLEPDMWVMIVDDVDTVFEKVLKKNFYKYLRINNIDDWTVEDKKNMLTERAVNSLLRAAAYKLGYYDYPKALTAKEDINRREAKLRVKQMMRDIEYKPSKEEIEQYYNEHFIKRYKEKKPLHIQHIIFEDSVLALIIRDSVLAGADFKEMALRYYASESAEPEIIKVAYDLGYISDEELGPEFFNTANSLEINDVSLPYKTEWGYHIIKLVDKRTDKKLDQVRPGIRRALIEAAGSRVRRQYLDDWRSKTVIQVEKSSLGKYEFPESMRAVEIAP